MSVDAIGAVACGGNGFVGGQPIQVTFVTSIEMVITRTGGTHGIEAIPIFDTRARSNDALAGGIPEIRVIESLVMTEFVAGDTRLVLARFKYWGNGPYAGWGSVDLVDATTGDDVVHLDKSLGIELPAIAVSGDGNTLVGCNGGNIEMSDANTGKKLPLGNRNR